MRLSQRVEQTPHLGEVVVPFVTSERAAFPSRATFLSNLTQIQSKKKILLFSQELSDRWTRKS